MRIPQVTEILTTYEPIPENLFNPILHASPESVREDRRAHTEYACVIQPTLMIFIQTTKDGVSIAALNGLRKSGKVK